MGKKSKKLDKIQLSQVPLEDLGKSEEEYVNPDTISCSASTNSLKKSKKKARKRENDAKTDDIPEQMQSEEVIESNASPDSSSKIQKKRTKGRPDTVILEAGDEEESSKINEIELTAPKKKKKKGHSLDQEHKINIDQDNAEIVHSETQKSTRKKKNKDKLLSELDLKDKILTQQSGDKIKKKKSRNKAKTGAPVLNDEEAQVTQEDIDKFCDELDEEDNKQYEDWVKLLDARLSKKQIKNE